VRFVGVDLAWGGRNPSGLAAADPPLRLDADRLLARELLALSDRRGQALKAVEDLADAHVCAYVALWWWWWHGPAASLVAGDDATGAIVVPLPARR
jgi:predicted RNase H-like nuclease